MHMAEGKPPHKMLMLRVRKVIPKHHHEGHGLVGAKGDADPLDPFDGYDGPLRHPRPDIDEKHLRTGGMSASLDHGGDVRAVRM